MKYVNTSHINNRETVVVVLPLSAVPHFDPDNPPPGAYCVGDDVQKGWVMLCHRHARSLIACRRAFCGECGIASASSPP